MSLPQLGLVLLLGLGLEATPQNYPGMSQSTADWYIRRFNKMAPDMIPEQILGFNKMAPDYGPVNKILALPEPDPVPYSMHIYIFLAAKAAQ